MTGIELIKWVQDNQAENMEIVWIDDGCALRRAHPEVVENQKLKDELFVNVGWLNKDGKSVVI